MKKIKIFAIEEPVIYLDEDEFAVYYEATPYRRGLPKADRFITWDYVEDDEPIDYGFLSQDDSTADSESHLDE